MNTEPQKHWLVRPENIKKLWVVFIAVLALTVIAKLFVESHPYFAIEGVFAFNAWYGFGACVAMVVGAKALAVLLKRKDTYYDGDD